MNPQPKQKRIKLSKSAWGKLREQVWNEQAGKCDSCGKWVALHGTTIFDTAHLAHIKSRGSGGGDLRDNVKILCYGCHFGAGEHGLVWGI